MSHSLTTNDGEERPLGEERFSPGLEKSAPETPKSASSDLVGGGLTLLFGAGVVYIASGYRIGWFNQMGPGMFPLLIGIGIAVTGLVQIIIVLSAHKAAEEDTAGNERGAGLRALLAVSLALLSWALLVKPFGFIPATAVTIALAHLAESPLKPRSMMISILVAPVSAYVLFAMLLRLPFQAFSWPSWNF